MGELTASESGIAVVHEDCTKNTEYPFIFDVNPSITIEDFQTLVA